MSEKSSESNAPSARPGGDSRAETRSCRERQSKDNPPPEPKKPIDPEYFEGTESDPAEETIDLSGNDE